jgi:XTP/dITP diphosphohydrolase
MTDSRIVIASGNQGKLREMRHLLAPRGFTVAPQSEFGVEDVAETGLTFVENAIIKARHASGVTGLPAIADDSGLEVDALNGAPGIYSSRYAGNGANDTRNIQKLLKAIEGVDDELRTARFQCLLVYMRHHEDPTPIICQGTWEGLITHHPKGSHGFGYDPIFFVREQSCTAAELAKEVKNTLSHRARAMRLLLDKLPG